MKNPILLFATILIMTLTSCVKDSPFPEASRQEDGSVTYEFDVPAQTGVSDRTLTLHYFYLTNAQITGGYIYQLNVRRQSDNQLVRQSGGWFAGNTSSSKNLDTELVYKAFLTLTPAYPGYTGTIHWKLTRGYESCISEGNRNIPSDGAIADPWLPCE